MKYKKRYSSPYKSSEKCFDTSALSCGKPNHWDCPTGSTCTVTGSKHFAYSYDTFTGHMGPGFGGGGNTSTGNAGVGFGPTGATQSYGYSGLCANWVSIAS